MSVFSADGKRRKVATKPALDGAQDFLRLPREILIHEICSYLPVLERCTFLGQTCQAIRTEYYTPTSVFTPARPLEVYIDETTDHIMPCSSYAVRLFLQAFAKSETIPVSFVLGCRPLPCTCRRRPLSEFKYVICKLTVNYANQREVVRFLARHPSFGCLSTIHIENWRSFGSPPSETTFPSVRTLCIHRIGNPIFADEISDLTKYFPNAMFRADVAETPPLRICRLLQPYPAYREIIQSILERMQAIDEMHINEPLQTVILDYIRRCIHLATGRIVIDDRAAGDGGNPSAADWGDTLASELSKRGPIDVVYHFRGPVLRSSAFAKYITHVTISDPMEMDCAAQRLSGMLHMLTSVRRLECWIHVQANVRISITAPADILVSAGPDIWASIVFAFESPVPMRQSDLQCATSLLIGIRNAFAPSTLNWSETRKRVSQEMAAVKLRLPQGYDPAWRLTYEIDKPTPKARPIKGYV